MNNYEGLGPYIAVIIAVLAALYYKDRSDKSGAKVITSETEAKDAPLVAQQKQNESEIKKVDEGIQKMIDERNKLHDQHLTDQERANSWNQDPSKKS